MTLEEQLQRLREQHSRGDSKYLATGCLRFRMANDLWFAKMAEAARRHEPFNEPQPKTEDYTS